MSAGMPELGSKINIITKADIRYEGRLFTVDPEKCTIALANVRSYGTEDRETLAPVPPQNQIYDYILFRGRDIKDIGYVNNNVSSLPNDPAIVQMSCPQTLSSSAYQPTGYSLPVMGPMGTGLSQYTSPYSALGVMPGLATQVSAGLGLSHDPRSLTKQSELVNPVQVPETATTDDQDLITGSPRSATPLLSRKSPTVDQGVQVNQPGTAHSKDEMKQAPARPIQPPSAREGIRGASGRMLGRNVIGQQPLHVQQQQQQIQYQPLPQREKDHDRQQQKLPSMVAPQRDQPLHQLREQSQMNHHQPQGHIALPQRVQQQQHQQQQQQHPQQQQQQHHQHHQHQQQHQQQQLQQQLQQQQHQQQQRSGWINRSGLRRGRGRGQNFNRSVPPTAKPKTLKFDDDYDFEQANTEFDKLMSQLNKTKISVDTDSGSTSDPKVNGDSDKKEDSGNETGAGEGEPEEEHEVFYDKNKSFFDNISCEAVERSKGRSQRTDWRTERKLNSETFGVASARRGGYRGRGFYGNRGMGGIFRSGGYRGNYRGLQGGPRNGRMGGFNLQGGTPLQQRPIVAQSK